MAEIVGIIGSAIAIANSAATLSRALFDIIETIQNARKEIADIAQQLQLLSGTLQMLWDYIHSQPHLCRPGLFRNINAILEQYLQVDKELRELIKTPKSLARLTWGFKKTKVKSQLQRIEAVKTSLSLALSVVQLAREEAIRPPAEAPSAVQAQPLPNRFRKLVESAVQVNRQVIENAQRQDAEATHTSSDQQRAEIDFYKEGSFDSATWLYHLVFSTQSPDTSNQSATQSPRPYQASVVDESTENVVRFAPSRVEHGSDPQATSLKDDMEKTMIVWGRQTEPSRVADRLLSEWTTLSKEQIELSSTRQHDDGWWDSFVKVVEEAKDENESDFEKWETQYSSDDSSAVVEIPTPHTRKAPLPPYRDSSVPFRQRSLSSEYGSVTSVDDPGLEQLRKDDRSKPPRQDSSHSKIEKDQRRVNSTRFRKNRASQKPLSRRMPSTLPGEDDIESDAFPRWNPEPCAEPSRHSQRSELRYPQATIPRHPQNPFRSNESYSQNPVPPYWYPPPTVPYPQDSPWPSREPIESLKRGNTIPTAPPTSTKDSSEPAMSQESTKQDDLLAAIASVIENAQKKQEAKASEPQFDRIVKLLITQQEHQVQAELERARVTAEVEMKQILAARDVDDAKIQRLEKLIMQQRDEQQEANARWQAERAALDGKAAEQTRQAQELAERQIAAARSAKKAERKTLKFAKAEAEKREKEASEAKAKEERKKIDRQAKERIQKYESLLDRAVDTQSQSLTISEQPFRRTCIVNGNHRMEVEEYAENNRGTSNFLASRLLEQAMMGVGSDGVYHNDQSRATRHRTSRMDRPPGSLSSSRLSEVDSNTADSSSEDRQMILFPQHLDQSSTKINELQSSLADIGLDVKFADLDMSDQATWLPKDRSTDIVRSSIFWEAPVLSSGSELLNTLRAFGWRPPYARSSDAGQTYFLGSQPIHSYFFRPDYRPQFSPCKLSDYSETIIIDQALIQKHVLLEFGFQFEVTKHGSYVLDGRLQYSDIEALIERSFAMQETYHRRAYRQLAPAPNMKQPGREQMPQYFEEPQSPTSTTGSDACETVSDSEDENEGRLERRSSYASSSVDTCLGLEPAGRSSNASLKTASESRTSWSEQSNNPFRKCGVVCKSGDGEGGSMIGFPDSIWDGALIDLS